MDLKIRIDICFKDGEFYENAYIDHNLDRPNNYFNQKHNYLPVEITTDDNGEVGAISKKGVKHEKPNMSRESRKRIKF